MPEVVQRFVEEAQIGGQLQHPGVVPVYGLGIQSDGRPYFAMKLVKGKTLARPDSGRRGPHDADLGLRAHLPDRGVRPCSTRDPPRPQAEQRPGRDLTAKSQVVDWGFAKVLARGGASDEPVADTPVPDLSIIETVRTKQTGSDVARRLPPRHAAVHATRAGTGRDRPARRARRRLCARGRSSARS